MSKHQPSKLKVALAGAKGEMGGYFKQLVDFDDREEAIDDLIMAVCSGGVIPAIMVPVIAYTAVEQGISGAREALKEAKNKNSLKL